MKNHLGRVIAMAEHAIADSPRPDLVVVNKAPDQPATGGIAGDSINAARFLAIDAVEQADSGHPGTPMGLAPLMYRLYTRHLRHDPADPEWADRDRFVLSSGHASMMLYAALHLSGYDLSIDYTQSPPPPPLNEADADWVRELLGHTGADR